MGLPRTEQELAFTYIGMVLSIFMYGMFISQAIFYYRQYPHDKLPMKSFVAFLVFADTLHSVFSITWIYDKLIKQFHNEPTLGYSTWLFDTYPALVGIISTSVQLFFAWRVKVLTGNKFLSSIIALLALAQVSGGLAYALEAGKIGEFSGFWKFKSLIIAWLSLSAVCDIMITTALTYTMKKHKSKRLAVTEGIVNRIMKLTLQNGLLITVWTIVDLITLVTTSNGAHFMFCYTLAKLYMNSLISSLNARPVISEGIIPTYSSGGSRLMSTDQSTSFAASETQVKSLALSDDYSSGYMNMPMSPPRSHYMSYDSLDGPSNARSIQVAFSPPPTAV